MLAKQGVEGRCSDYSRIALDLEEHAEFVREAFVAGDGVYRRGAREVDDVEVAGGHAGGGLVVEPVVEVAAPGPWVRDAGWGERGLEVFWSQ